MMLALSCRDVLELLPLRDCIAAVERAFRLHAERQTFGPGVLGVPAGAGSVHVKVAGLRGERSYVAAKINANFPDNARRHGLPTIQGAVILADAEMGQHALAARLLTREAVHAELGDVVTGRRPGRTRDDEITIFDSSGTALQDVAAAIVVYETACATGRGTEVRLDD
jgi:ornithine cyclodeaminase/alanine dehydrogenase-like protein (mu-crystallin family)